MIKLAITLTWSKIMASIILVLGFAFSILLLKDDSLKTHAPTIFSTCVVITAGLLGWRQATTTLKSTIPFWTKKSVLYDDGVSKESSEVPVTDP